MPVAPAAMRRRNGHRINRTPEGPWRQTGYGKLISVKLIHSFARGVHLMRLLTP